MLTVFAITVLTAFHGGAFPTPPPPPAPPPSPGNFAPAPPGSGPTSPGGRAAGPGIGTAVSGGLTGQGQLDWTRWWKLERERFLGLRDLKLKGPISGGKKTTSTRLSLVPGRNLIDSSVLPALLHVLETERDDSMISAALIGAARIGSGGRRDLSLRIGVLLQEQLHKSSQEISETAALSLGIFGERTALEPLIALLKSDKEGARLVGKRSVPTRTRSFAAFGLGLMAHGSSDPQVRQRIAAALCEVLEEPHNVDDLPTACVIAFGLCPLPQRLTVPDQATRESAFAHQVVSRTAQVRWFTKLVATPRRGSNGLPPVVRTHAAVALGRLVQDAELPVRTAALDALEELATSRRNRINLRTASFMGLGEGLTAGSDHVDILGLRSLIKIVQSGQVQERHFAAIALAEATSRRGNAAAIDDGSVPVDPQFDAAFGDKTAGWESLELGRRVLMRHLARGRAESMPWFAMALGVQNWHLQRAGVPWNPTVAAAMREKVRTTRSASFIGAYAIACGLVHQGADTKTRLKAGLQVHNAFGRTRDPKARGHVAIALGLLDYEPAREDLVDLLDSSRFQPELLWSAAVALILSGDSTVIPTLIDTLEKARSSASRGAAAAALGRVGDSRAVEPLLELLHDKSQANAARAFAIVGLGLLCEAKALPWRTPAIHVSPYFEVTGTLFGNGKGLLDLN